MGTRILLALSISLWLVACGEPPVQRAPQQLVGVWTTEAPSHADRFLEFGARTVSFGTGDHGSVTHLIDEVSSAPGELAGSTHYTITYLDSAGERSRIRFELRPTRPLPTLVLDHRDELWFPRIHKPGEERE